MDGVIGRERVSIRREDGVLHLLDADLLQGHFDMVEGEPQDIDELKKDIEKHYESLPKCDHCGKMRDDKVFFAIYGDPDYGKFCSESCAEEAFLENEEQTEE